MEKRQIKVAFVGFWDGFTAEKTRIYLDISKYYNVVLSEEFTSEEQGLKYLISS